jgi:hypothetical protein
MLNIILLLVPGQLTWLLQPLDVEVFRTFKETLRTLQFDAREEHEQGLLTVEQRVAALTMAIQCVMIEGHFATVFEKCGYTDHNRNLHSKIAQYVPEPHLAEPKIMTDADMVNLIGRNRIKMSEKFFATPRRLSEYHANERLAREQEHRKEAEEEHHIMAEIDDMMCDPMLESISESMSLGGADLPPDDGHIHTTQAGTSSSSSSSTVLPKATAKASAKASATSDIVKNTRAAKKAKLQ